MNFTSIGITPTSFPRFVPPPASKPKVLPTGRQISGTPVHIGEVLPEVLAMILARCDRQASVANRRRSLND